MSGIEEVLNCFLTAPRPSCDSVATQSQPRRGTWTLVELAIPGSPRGSPQSIPRIVRYCRPRNPQGQGWRGWTNKSHPRPGGCAKRYRENSAKKRKTKNVGDILIFLFL